MTNAIKIKNFNSSIKFQNVEFKYDINSESKILEEINIEINKGEMIAIVGESGAGKSTFSELIPRLYDVSEGILMIDGIDIKKYSLKSLRNLIAVVTQNSILFNETIKSNIAYGNNNVSDLQVSKAIKSAKDMKIKVIGLSGKDGGEMKKLCDVLLMPSKSTEKIQESHIMIGHIVCSIVEHEYFSTK